MPFGRVVFNPVVKHVLIKIEYRKKELEVLLTQLPTEAGWLNIFAHVVRSQQVRI